RWPDGTKRVNMDLNSDLNKNSKADLLDEFEFRPLSSGLGFHKGNPSSSGSTSRFEIKEALPRAGDLANSSASLPVSNSGLSVSSEREARESAEKSLTKSHPALPDFLERKPSAKLDAGDTKNWVPSVWEPGAILLDALLVSALFLICLMLLISITKIDLFSSLSQPDPQRMVYWSLASLWMSLCFSYLNISRAFFANTLGEWVFEQRIGEPQQMKSPSYVLLVGLRSLILFGTGFIVLPLVSFALNRDLVGSWSRVPLMKKPLR
ncbi:MAG: hypothetical protein WCH11_05025, partial [Bdellovibrio sp.]